MKKTIPTTAENQIGVRFRLKDGSLSAYSFLCGYVQEKVKGENYKKLFMEHEHYHVMSGKIGERFSTWETFGRNELTKARKLYRTIKMTKT